MRGCYDACKLGVSLSQSQVQLAEHNAHELEGQIQEAKAEVFDQTPIFDKQINSSQVSASVLSRSGRGGDSYQIV